LRGLLRALLLPVLLVLHRPLLLAVLLALLLLAVLLINFRSALYAESRGVSCLGATFRTKSRHAK